MDLCSNTEELVLEQSKILVIDDDQLVRESIAIYLEDSGYSLKEACDGNEGLALFEEFSPDLVLCDLRMPEMDGLEVLKQLTQSSPTTPIIIVSGAGQIHDVVEALRLGALDYLVKPVTDMAVLENAVVNALTRHQLEAQNKVYRQELEQANKELEKNLDLLQQDQEAGRRAQLQLLPEPNERINGYLFEHLIVPSLNLSGDFIDYFRISERYIGFYIADVSGHGAAAAFVTMTLKSLVNQPLRKFRVEENDLIIKPAEFMAYLNNEFINANLDKHITFFYGVIDCHEQKLNYSVGGQYPAPVMMNNGQLQLLNQSGFPLGLFDWVSFESYEVTISSDFQLILVSDGWLELFSTNDEPAQELFLMQYLEKNPLSIDILTEPVRQYPNNNTPDDITIFLITKQLGS